MKVSGVADNAGDSNVSSTSNLDPKKQKDSHQQNVKNRFKILTMKYLTLII